ncbi:MAG: alanine racemase, partial [Bacteroidota bacterium]|nr:alanine racemase [Bacteroidota bacterium]
MKNVTTPTLLLNTKQCRQNIKSMVRKAQNTNVLLRPHFKTHQSRMVGKWFRNEGIHSITVSSVKMAQYFAQDGWKNISIAFPVNLLEATEINELAANIKLNVLIAGTQTVPLLDEKISNELGVWIKIDTGYGRSGISSEKTGEIEQLLAQIQKSKYLRLEGFLSHTGNTYHASSTQEIVSLFSDAKRKLSDLKKNYIMDFPDIKISLGDTPSASLVSDFSEIDEIRPGNFVFYDFMQYRLGSCNLKEIAVALACPVVALYPDRNQMIVYGGAVHLSKEYIVDKNGEKNFGQLLKFTSDGWQALESN